MQSNQDVKERSCSPVACVGKCLKAAATHRALKNNPLIFNNIPHWDKLCPRWYTFYFSRFIFALEKQFDIMLLILGLIFLVILLLAVVLLTLRYRKMLKYKNRSIVKQINENDKLQETMERVFRRITN